MHASNIGWAGACSLWGFFFHTANCLPALLKLAYSSYSVMCRQPAWGPWPPRTGEWSCAGESSPSSSRAEGYVGWFALSLSLSLNQTCLVDMSGWVGKTHSEGVLKWVSVPPPLSSVPAARGHQLDRLLVLGARDHRGQATRVLQQAAVQGEDEFTVHSLFHIFAVSSHVPPSFVCEVAGPVYPEADADSGVPAAGGRRGGQGVLQAGQQKWCCTFIQGNCSKVLLIRTQPISLA